MQPSEFLKLALVLFAADLLVRRHDHLSDVRRSLRPIALVAAFAAGACLLQGDLGSAIVMTAIVLAVAFIGGVPLSPMLATGLVAAVAALGFVFSTEYRYQRFTAFLDITGHRDHLSYQTYQGFLSIADGGLTGSGVGAGNGKLGYLPLAHSDFIFAVIADELGLVGSIAVIGGFMLLVWFGIQTALAAPDRFGMLLAGGITTWFGVQAVINLGGVTGLMPVTGLTLPFFSAGGSSLFVSMTAAGLLLNVARRDERCRCRDVTATRVGCEERVVGGHRPSRRGAGTTANRPMSADRTFAVVTGGGTAGHVLPALAIAEALVDRGHEPGTIHYIGAARGIETRLLPATPFPHTFLDVTGLQRELNVANVRRNASMVPKLVGGPTGRRPRAARPAAGRRRVRRRLRQPAGRAGGPPPAHPGRRRQLRPPARPGQLADGTHRGGQRRRLRRLAAAACRRHRGAAAPQHPGRRPRAGPRPPPVPPSACRTTASSSS